MIRPSPFAGWTSRQATATINCGINWDPYIASPPYDGGSNRGGRPQPTRPEEGTTGDNTENDKGHPGQCTTERYRCPISNRIWWLTTEGEVKFERERYKCTNTGRIWWQTADGVVRFEDELTCEGSQKGEQLLDHTFVLIDELTHSTGSTGCEAKANETCAVAGLAANIKSPMKPEMTCLPPAAEYVRLRQNMYH